MIRRYIKIQKLWVAKMNQENAKEYIKENGTSIVKYGWSAKILAGRY